MSNLVGLSLFSGGGGFDLGMRRAGIRVVIQVEKIKMRQACLCRHFPEVEERFTDVRYVNHIVAAAREKGVSIVFGGDPCQSRSKAKGGRASVHPDLSGYFLAVAGGCQARWVVRENVCASDAVWFMRGLELLGYRVISFIINARDVTPQNRRRQFIVGCDAPRAAALEKSLADFRGHDLGWDSAEGAEEPLFVSAITAHPNRFSESDTQIWEGPGWGLRHLLPEEAERLQGFPGGYTDGFSRFARFQIGGEAVSVPVAEWVGRRILEVEDAL